MKIKAIPLSHNRDVMSNQVKVLGILSQVNCGQPCTLLCSCRYDEVPFYDAIELIADSGGLLGAYVGWCIYALYEPLKNAASRLCALCRFSPHRKEIAQTKK